MDSISLVLAIATSNFSHCYIQTMGDAPYGCEEWFYSLWNSWGNLYAESWISNDTSSIGVSNANSKY